MLGVDFPVEVLESFVMGTFLALDFTIFAFVVPFAATVAIFLDARAVVLLLVTAVVFACVFFFGCICCSFATC